MSQRSPQHVQVQVSDEVRPFDAEDDEEYEEQEQWKPWDKDSEESEVDAPAGAFEHPPVWDSLEFSSAVHLTIALVVVLNVIAIGFETDLGCMTCEGENWNSVDAIFVVFFLLDVLARIVITGFAEFFVGSPFETGRRIPLDVGNCFDFFIVLTRVLGLLLSMAGIPNTLKAISLVRCLKVHAACNHSTFLKRAKGFRELYLIVTALGDTLKTVSWVMLMILFFVSVFGIIFTVAFGKSDSVRDSVDYSESDWEAEAYWGTVVQSVCTLFQIALWDDWSPIVWPLVRRYPVLILVFVFFLVMTTMCIMQITGAVIETTLNVSKVQSTTALQEIQKQERLVQDSLQQKFLLADKDRNGDLDRDELSYMLAKQSVCDRLEFLQISRRDIEMLFNLLDRDSTGLIPITKMFRGCGRLKGAATAADLYYLSVDLQRLADCTVKLSSQTDANNDVLGGVLDYLDMADRELIRSDNPKQDPVIDERVRRGQTRQLSASATIRSLCPSQAKKNGITQPKTNVSQAQAEEDTRMASIVSLMTQPGQRRGQKSLVAHAIQAEGLFNEQREPMTRGQKASENHDDRRSSLSTKQRATLIKERKSNFMWDT